MTLDDLCLPHSPVILTYCFFKQFGTDPYEFAAVTIRTIILEHQEKGSGFAVYVDERYFESSQRILCSSLEDLTRNPEWQ